MVSLCFLCIHVLAVRGCFSEAEILKSVEQSFSDSVRLQVAVLGTLAWGLTAGDLSFPVEREPMQVPVHHPPSTI